jgi:outer membrane protein OmpA-like peptidoglycan-associated protein
MGGTTVPAEAQIFNRLKNAAKEAAAREVENQLNRMISGAIQCALSDPVCIKEAKDEGQTVVYTDDEGDLITDSEGNPVTDEETAQATVEQPGGGVWANYDFVPGDKVLFTEDYTTDKVGDFPKRLQFLNGNMEVVEWSGAPWLRATAGSAFAIDLPETLPDRFTLEFSVSWKHGNQWMRVLFSDPPEGRVVQPRGVGWYAPAHLLIDERNTGLQDFQQDGPFAMSQITGRITGGIAEIRLMADGQYVKVYVGEKRVANVPQVDIGRANKIWFVVADATDELPMFVGPIRVAGGGADLYDKLAEEGRVTTRGILFAIDSDKIRPESTPTLEEIGKMLTDHLDLEISIEGHTDNTGDDKHNKDLSQRRAKSVRQFLIETYGIEGKRLESKGFGASNPVDTNDTPEGRQNNRRVELVRLEK